MLDKRAMHDYKRLKLFDKALSAHKVHDMLKQANLYKNKVHCTLHHPTNKSNEEINEKIKGEIIV